MTDAQRVLRKQAQSQRVAPEEAEAELDGQWMPPGAHDDGNDDFKTTALLKVEYPSHNPTTKKGKPIISQDDDPPASNTRASRHQCLLTAMDISGISITAQQAAC